MPLVRERGPDGGEGEAEAVKRRGGEIDFEWMMALGEVEIWIAFGCEGIYIVDLSGGILINMVYLHLNLKVV